MRAVLQAFLVLLVVIGVVSANVANASALPCHHTSRQVVTIHDTAVSMQMLGRDANAADASHKSSHHQHPAANCNEAVCCAGMLAAAIPATFTLPVRLAASADIPSFASVQLTTRAVAPPHGPPRLTI